MKNVLHLMVMVQISFLTACGGGGGSNDMVSAGSGTASGASVTSVAVGGGSSTNKVGVQATTNLNSSTATRNNNNNQVEISPADNSLTTGGVSKVNVGMVDSGLDPTYRYSKGVAYGSLMYQYKGSGALSDTSNYSLVTVRDGDADYHGSTMAEIMTNYALNNGLSLNEFSIYVGAEQTNYVTENLVLGQLLAQNGASIINNSWNVPDSVYSKDGLKGLYKYASYFDRIKSITDGGVLFVISSGNSSTDHPEDMSLAPLLSGYEDIAKSFLTVVGVNENNAIANDSARCGVEKIFVLQLLGNINGKVEESLQL